MVTTLAAGIAASTLVFSLMNPYFFRALPFPAAEELVQVGGVDPLEGWDGGRFSAPQIADMADRSRSLAEIGGYYYGTTNLATDEGEVRRENVGRLSGNLMGLLGARPLLGRTRGFRMPARAPPRTQPTTGALTPLVPSSLTRVSRP